MPQSLVLKEIYVLLQTSTPIRRRLLYFIFKHDGHMMTAEMAAKISKRYGLPDLPSEEESAKGGDPIPPFLMWCTGEPILNCLRDFSNMLEDTGTYVQELQLAWPDCDDAWVLSRRSIVAGGAHVWWRQLSNGARCLPQPLLATADPRLEPDDRRGSLLSIIGGCQLCWDVGFTEPVVKKLATRVGVPSALTKASDCDAVVDMVGSKPIQTLLYKTASMARLANWMCEISLGETRRTTLASKHLGPSSVPENKSTKLEHVVRYRCLLLLIAPS